MAETTADAAGMPECDVIMKGGITSGVVYPGVVCELAKHYRLRSIGGASAGAIAAAVAAAAEYGRDSNGFDKLAEVPAELTATSSNGDSVLYGLFQPAAETKALYRVFTAALGKSGMGRLRSVALAVVRSFPWAVLLGAVPGVAVTVCGIVGGGVAAVGAIVAGVLLIVLGAAIGAAFEASRSVLKAVPAKNFGVCMGMPTDDRPGRPAALTPWLHAKIQAAADRTAADDPLTFAELAGRGCDLRMVTTNVTLRQSIRLPLTGDGYFFRPADFRLLFPTTVVDWMVRCALKSLGRPASDATTLDEQELLPLPAGDDLPVLVATRMSLSFPFLISAVPLYTVDWATTTDPDNPRYGVNWFSDGGICSNLPVHFFDCPVPTRPTFAIDLAPFGPGQEKSSNESDNTYLPPLDAPGRPARWGRWPQAGLRGLSGFATAVFNSAQCWVDESEAAMPGYHDRIATVFQDGKEGGMNLTMPKAEVDSLVTRGREAAKKLLDRFGDGSSTTPADGWENQRWLRFRTATAGLSDWLAAFGDGYNGESKLPATPYSSLAGPGASTQLPWYPIAPANTVAVNNCTDELLKLTVTWSKAGDAFTAGLPAQRPLLRLMPPEGFE
jgi:predicted acylesterase/phospholipase RssA